MALYKLASYGVLNTYTGENIPNDTTNRHWQEYLAWCETGNTADAADSAPAPQPPVAAAMQSDVAYSALVKAMALHFNLTLDQIVAMINAQVGT